MKDYLAYTIGLLLGIFIGLCLGYFIRGSIEKDKGACYQSNEKGVSE